MTRTRDARAIRVAFAEDHIFVRAGMRRFIASIPGFEVAGEAANAEEALELVQATDIDVLVLDVNMPDRSGLEVLPQLLALAPRMKVLVASAMPGSTMRPVALRAGACGYLEKPVNPLLLEHAIRAAAAAARLAANDEGFVRRGEASHDEGTRT
jgi:DNA-binding NarL/FixJ family response regulator